MVTDLPDEILARAFEIGTLVWDIRFLPPLRLVCHSWNDIVMTTPRLWGIITIDKESNVSQLMAQVLIAKHSPLSIYVQRTKFKHEKVLRTLVDRSSNWVNADVPTSMLRLGRWPALSSSIEALRLRCSGGLSPEEEDRRAAKFFDVQGAPTRVPLRLRSFSAHSIRESWLLPFLSPSIASFEFRPNQDLKLFDTLRYLSKVPQISSLILEGVRHHEYDLPETFQHPVHLASLEKLVIERVLYPATILSEIAAPSLQTLIIIESGPRLPEWTWPYQRLRRAPELKPLSPFFLAWSHPGARPTQLRSLTLKQCLQVSDVAFLIRWLARLPSLTHLVLQDDAISQAAELPPSDEETNLLTALISPEGAGTVGGWLCPSLMRLQLLSMDVQIGDLLSLARVRGNRSTMPKDGLRGQIRHLDALLCPSGSAEEIEEVRGLIEETVCGCFECQFNLSI